MGRRGVLRRGCRLPPPLLLAHVVLLLQARLRWVRIRVRVRVRIRIRISVRFSGLGFGVGVGVGLGVLQPHARLLRLLLLPLPPHLARLALGGRGDAGRLDALLQV